MTTTTEKHVCPPDHKHGAKNTCRTKHGCRCADCTRAHREHARAVRRAKAYGRWEPPLISARGAQRRLQALVRQGWSQTRLGVELGWAQQRVNQVLACQRVTRDVHAQIDQLFRRLWDQEPPCTTKWEVAAVVRAKAYAQDRGWPRPLDWDDIDHDDGPASIEHVTDDDALNRAIRGDDVTITPKQRVEAVEVLHGYGLNDLEIAARLHCSDRTVLRIRHNKLRLTANEHPRAA